MGINYIVRNVHCPKCDCLWGCHLIPEIQDINDPLEKVQRYCGHCKWMMMYGQCPYQGNVSLPIHSLCGDCRDAD